MDNIKTMFLVLSIKLMAYKRKVIKLFLKNIFNILFF